jgi:hypothetical protein
MQKNLLITIIMLLIIPAAWSQEFLLHDKTYTWHADDDVCGGYSYWYDHGNAPTMNWTSPFDYQNGLFYYYFEIIEQPSSAPFKLNFCIWADRTSDGTSWQESCGYRSGVLAGPGSSAQFSSPVLPALNGGIDWSDLSKLWRFGIPLWVNGHNMGLQRQLMPVRKRYRVRSLNNGFCVPICMCFDQYLIISGRTANKLHNWQFAD